MQYAMQTGRAFKERLGQQNLFAQISPTLYLACSFRSGLFGIVLPQFTLCFEFPDR
jgi:hypothetical protein